MFDLKIFKVDDGSEIAPGSPVVIGTRVEARATPLSAYTDTITDWFLSMCIATGSVQGQSLLVIENGCMKPLGTLNDAINAESSNSVQSLYFNQFAFTDQSQSKQKILNKITFIGMNSTQNC